MQADINEVSLAFDDTGSGPAVILIHGFPLCRRMWRPQTKALTEAGFRVVAPDLRGFGESSAPAGPYSMSLFADDIIGLMDHLGLAQAVIGGMSMGGYVLFNLLERYPGRAAAALFLVTRAGGENEEGRTNRTRMAHAVAEEGPGVVTKVFSELVFADGTAERRPELVAQARGWMEAATPHGLEGALLAMRDRKDFMPDLALLDVPALVVGAEKDRAIPLEQSRRIAAGLPRATFRSIPEAGHLANLEQPEAFNRCLVDYLQNLHLR
ncbi:MAG: alpha/beta fold hydrolase [Desulfuromonadales bacterium]